MGYRKKNIFHIYYTNKKKPNKGKGKGKEVAATISLPGRFKFSNVTIKFVEIKSLET